jgi:hypothetical protein
MMITQQRSEVVWNINGHICTLAKDYYVRRSRPGGGHDAILHREIISGDGEKDSEDEMPGLIVVAGNNSCSSSTNQMSVDESSLDVEKHAEENNVQD